MALTVVLNAYSIAYPSITNNIRVDIMKQSNPAAVVATQTDSVVGHPARIWSFPGLPRTDYIFTMNEIDNLGNPINNLAYFNVVPDQIDGALVRDDEQIVFDVTPGLVSGVQTIMFDGSGGRPDYRGWNINPERRIGGGTMQRGVEYDWNPSTGQLDLLILGDVTQASELWNIDFDPIATPAGGSVGSVTGFECKLITGDYTLTVDDFGKKLIVEPTANYCELTLPLASTVIEGVRAMIEVVKSINCCVKIITSDTLAFLAGNIFICRNEKISIYNFVRSTGVYEFRADNCDGNFKDVGKIVEFDAVEADLYNCLKLNGATLNIFQHARLFDYVNRLPSSQVVTYANWGIGDNYTKFSYASGSNFKAPDRRALYGRNTNADEAGVFYRMSIEKHKHVGAYNDAQSGGTAAPFGRTGQFGKIGSNATDFDNDNWFTNDGTEISGSNALNTPGVISLETRPNSYSINKYVLL